MTTVTDDFNRANGAAGAPWVPVGTMIAPTIASNRLSGSGAYPLVGFPGTDVDFSVKLISASSNIVALCWGDRAGDPSDPGYNGYYCLNNAAGNASISKSVAGSPTGLTTVGGKGTPAANDVFRFTRVGNVLTFYKNAVSVATATDSSSPLSGLGYAQVHNMTVGTNVWDDFTVTYTPAGGGAPAAPTTLQLWPRGNLVH